MFADFGAGLNLTTPANTWFEAVSPWAVAIRPWAIPAAGLAFILALIGLVLRSRSGSGGASSDPVLSEVVSTGAPSGRPRRPM